MTPAAARLRVEPRHSTLSILRKARSFFANVVMAGLTGGGGNWPPVDIVLINAETGDLVRRWHEYGGEATVFKETLEEDLDAMTYDEFVEKWVA